MMIFPLSADQACDIDQFPTRRGAQRRFSILSDEDRVTVRDGKKIVRRGKGLIHSLGLAHTDPEHMFRRANVYSARRIAMQNVQHEVDGGMWFWAMWPHAFALTGSDVDPLYKDDMDLTVGKRLYRCEIDRITERKKQLEDTLKKYDDCPNTVLFVTLTDWRVREILSLTKNPRVYATTLVNAVNSPWENHWRNCHGAPGLVSRVAQADAQPGAHLTAEVRR